MRSSKIKLKNIFIVLYCKERDYHRTVYIEAEHHQKEKNI